MEEKAFGSLIVVEERKIAGIITERDFLMFAVKLYDLGERQESYGLRIP